MTPKLILNIATQCMSFYSFFSNGDFIFFGLYNIVLFVILALVVGSVLYYCRKRKLTPYEQREKEYRDQEYVLSKIKQYQTVKKDSSITDLPYN